MKPKNKKVNKLYLNEALRKLINEDRNKVMEYFGKLVNAKRELYNVAMDCPVISQGIRQEIVGVCSHIKDIMYTMEENGYVSRMDNPERQFRSNDDLDESEKYPTYTQIRNVTGIEDDDELNAAVECERREALEDKIIGEFFGGLRNPNVFVFDKVCAALADKFGFKYVGHDDDREEHMFSNGEDVLHLFPKIYYPQQGSFRLRNAYISGK